jgi:hypothetical protein
LSVVALWSDYSALTDKLVRSAEDDGDLGVAWALAKMGMAYRDVAHQAVRMRVDQVTLDLISRPVFEMYTQQTRMELETVTVRPEGLRMLREFNKVTVTARTKHAATKAAAIPPGPTDDGPAFPQRAQKARSAAAKKREEAAAARKREEGAKRGPLGHQTHPRGRRLRRRHVRPPTAGRGPVIRSVKRPVPIWMGSLKAAKRWVELGTDSRAQLRYGIMERSNRDVAPFR